MKTITRTSLLLCTVLFTACASTKISTLKDPTYIGKSFKRIIIFADFHKIEYQKLAENVIVNRLRESGIYASTSWQVLPPIREYTDAEKVAIFRDYGFDCYAIVKSSGVGISTIHVPTYTSGGATASVYGNNATVRGGSVTSGGFTRETLSSMDFDLSVYDFNNGQRIIYSQATSSSSSNDNQYGIQWVSAEGFLKNACDNLAEEIANTRLLTVTAKE